MGAESKPIQMAPHKHPIPTRRGGLPTKFVTEWRGGAATSYWAPDKAKVVIANGAGGILGEIIDKMRRGEHEVRIRRSEWRPCHDYMTQAAYMPEGQREAFISRCSDWIAAHPPRVIARKKEPVQHDTEMIASLYARYNPRAPPLKERVKVWRAAGLPESNIEKALKFYKMMEETADERQQELDDFFAKWPAASKPTPKPRAKVIKAVKKRTS